MSEPNDPTPKKAASKPDKSFGCFKLLLALCLFSVTGLLVTVFVIDKMNAGGKIKSAIRDIIKPEPEIKVVEKIVEKRVEVPVEKIVEKIVEVEIKPPMPSSYIPWQKIDTTKLWNGIQIASTVESSQGGVASLEREKEDAIQLQMKLTFNVPKAAESMEQLAMRNPNLPLILPDLLGMVDDGKVSPFYHQLYENKVNRIQQRATRLDQVLSVHNLYDTETVLELEHPETKQKVLFIQSDMDVVSDGSDGDRWPFLDNYISMSQYYQPFTSYGWAKQTTQPNPLLKKWEDELKKRQERFAVSGLSIEENRFLRSRIAQLEPEIEDMKARSYLIAEADPFIVMSLEFLGRRNETEFGPMIGDYAVVIHEDKIYPAIVGDAGPTFKFGEASLRLAKEINEKASPYNRPVSDLSVSYLVFPNSREEVNTPPNLEKWHQKCSEYIEKIGGIGQGFTLHEWEDIVPVKLEEWKMKNDPEYLLKRMQENKADEDMPETTEEPTTEETPEPAPTPTESETISPTIPLPEPEDETALPEPVTEENAEEAP